jgi:hypothetical protein
MEEAMVAPCEAWCKLLRYKAQPNWKWIGVEKKNATESGTRSLTIKIVVEKWNLHYESILKR